MAEKKFNHDEYLKEYRKNVLVRIALDMKRDKRDEIKMHADACGETLAGYVKKAIEMRMAIDGCKTVTEETPHKEEKVVHTVAVRPDFTGSYGTSIGDIGKAAAEKNRKQGKRVLTDKGYMIVYGQEAEAEE